MYEVEVKVSADHDAVRRALREAGATRRGTVRQVDTYYDAPHRSFAETDEALRIRRERPGTAGDAGDGDAEDPADGRAGTAVLTYKGPLIETASKTRREVETPVPEPERLDEILTALGFAAAAVVRKERTRYELAGYVVTLDSVDGLGEFVEVETEAREADVEAAREGAVELLDRLGLDPDDRIRTSYLELLLE